MNSNLSDQNRSFLEAFELFLGTRTKNTRTAYLRDVERLARATHPEALSLLSKQQLTRCLAQWHANGLSGRSLARILSSWREFYRFLLNRPDFGVTTDPCERLKAPKSVSRLPSALTPDEINLLFSKNTSLEKNPALYCRNLALFELTYSSGLRVSELVQLNLSQLNLEEKEARVLGKGGKERIVPIGRPAVLALENWLTFRNLWVKNTNESALFVSKWGRRLSVRRVQQCLDKWGVYQGLSQHLSPHMLRHSFASHLLQSSGDLRAVQELLGHASIASTQVYTHLDDQALVKVYDLAHPRAQKRTKKIPSS